MKGTTTKAIIHETFRSFLLAARRYKKRNVQIFCNHTEQKLWFYTEQTSHAWKERWPDIYFKAMGKMLKDGFVMV